ncbi:MAG: DUF2125 domain-containing protein [Proteobacteria bacterium]|nr:DUF2125 domain-containing protein [Pseudomonadota bacterium]
MRFLASLILALLLGAVAYAGFWWFSLAYNAAEMRGAVERTLNVKLTHGEATWIPNLMNVQVRWDSATVDFNLGPLAQATAQNVVMVSGFLSSDRWRLELPDTVTLRMTNGSLVMMRSKNAELYHLVDEGGRLVFRADEITLMNEQGLPILRARDVVVEQRPGDKGVRLSLQSVPVLAGDARTAAGQMVVPEEVLAVLMAGIGKDSRPDLQTLLHVVTDTLQKTGTTLTLENLSLHSGMASAALYGTLQVAGDGTYAGQLLVAAPTAQLADWVSKADVVKPRDVPESIGWRAAQRKMEGAEPSMRVEVAPDKLLINGYSVGPVPHVADVVARLLQ